MKYPKRPKNILIYYGWLNSLNSGVNAWNNEKVAQELATYDILVFGAGLQTPTHGDYSNTEIIIPRIKELNKNVLIFGYVTVNQSLCDFKTKVNDWNTLEVDGIFLDEAGYDFSKTRDEFNTRVAYVKSQYYAHVCFANAWNLDHILGTTNDVSYPNTTYNTEGNESLLDHNDWILLESFAVNTTAYGANNGYQSKTNWINRGNAAISKRELYNISFASIGIINNNNTNGQDLFEFTYNSALMFSFEANGTSDTAYGASSAAVTFWDRSRKRFVSDIKPEPVVDDDNANIYIRYGDFAKLVINHSDQDSELTQY